MLLEQLLYSLGSFLVDIPPQFYLVLFVLCMIGVGIISIILHYHLKKYTFMDHRTGMVRFVYLVGLGVLTILALILLGLIFGLS